MKPEVVVGAALAVPFLLGVAVCQPAIRRLRRELERSRKLGELRERYEGSGPVALPADGECSAVISELRARGGGRFGDG